MRTGIAPIRNRPIMILKYKKAVTRIRVPAFLYLRQMEAESPVCQQLFNPYAILIEGILHSADGNISGLHLT